MKRAADQRRVVLYARVSLDRGATKSVDDQLAAQRKWALGTGRTIVAELRDDGISASRFAGKKARPDWQVAMELISSGQVDELSVWEVSRSTRDRAVWAALIAACIENGVDFAVDGKVHDPSDPDDGFMLDLSFSLGVRESAATSKRTRRGVDSRAADGRPHGSLPYGYKRLLDPVTGKARARVEHPEQAPIVREIARRLLARESADSIAADLNQRGIPTGTGKLWRGSNMMKMALRPTYAGLRVYKGQVLDGVRGQWPAILTEEEHHLLVAMHRDPARDKFRNPTHVKYLGSGIYRCGREVCDGVMRIVVHHGRRPAHYDCRTCHGVSRDQANVDDLVEKLMWRRLARPDILELLAQGDETPVKEAAAEARRLRAKLKAARRAWDEDRISLEAYMDMEARTLPKIRDAEERARPKSVPPGMFEVAGEDAERKWKALSIGEKRTFVAAAMEVTILPAASWVWDPTRVQIRWRRAV